jgi:hypothetical protein
LSETITVTSAKVCAAMPAQAEVEQVGPVAGRHDDAEARALT